MTPNEAILHLRSKIRGGAIDKAMVMAELFPLSCDHDCGCDDCRGKRPSARLRLNTRQPTLSAQDLAHELRQHLNAHANIVAQATREEHSHVSQQYVPGYGVIEVVDIPDDPEIKAMSASQRTLGTHARGHDGDRRQIIADLVSNDASPYTPDDEEALRAMSYGTLAAMRDKYLKTGRDPDALLARSRNFAAEQERRALAGQRINSLLGLTPQRFATAEVEADEDDPEVLAMTAGDQLRAQIRQSKVRAR